MDEFPKMEVLYQNIPQEEYQKGKVGVIPCVSFGIRIRDGEQVKNFILGLQSNGSIAISKCSDGEDFSITHATQDLCSVH